MSIQERLQNVRTLEDIVYMLTILFTNLNNQNEMYYNMFLNPTPMDVELQRYDENGNLTTVTLANRAKDKILTYSGSGTPIGTQQAPIGSLYVDTESGNLYYKATGSDSYGWILVWSVKNLVAGTDFLAPDGNGSMLSNLNMANAGSGTLSVSRGGTGADGLSGLIKGNGTSPFTIAEEGVDYVTPNSLIGLIMYCPMETIPPRCLVCDGSIYDISERPELNLLFEKLSNKYGGDGETTFAVPNLIGKYVKGGLIEDIGIEGNANIGEHYHTLSGDTGEENEHKHDAGTLNITGYADLPLQRLGNANGALYYTNISQTRNDTGSSTQETGRRLNLDASLGWNPDGLTGAGSTHKHSLAGIQTSTVGNGEPDVNHIVMVPVIRY